jgi:anti-sigma factor RsiW
MHDRFNDDLSDDPGSSPLDELLCEYVDGTMDPDVCRVFEEYLQANPGIAAQVEDLKHTRSLLANRRDFCAKPPLPLQLLVQTRIAREIVVEEAGSEAAVERLSSWAFVASTALILFLAGMVAGAVINRVQLLPVPADAAIVEAGLPVVEPEAAKGALTPAWHLSAGSPLPASYHHGSAPGFVQASFVLLDARP